MLTSLAVIVLGILLLVVGISLWSLAAALSVGGVLVIGIGVLLLPRAGDDAAAKGSQ